MRWLVRLFRREALEQELDRELRFHVETRTEELIGTGLNAIEARRRALAEFGGVEPIKEEARDARGTRWVGDFAQDIRYALRMLRANKGFTVAAVLSLGLGIGANAAVFRAINGLLLRPLDVTRPNELVILESSNAKESRFSHPLYLKLAGAAPDAQLAAMTRPANMQITVNGVAELANAQLISASWFRVLDVTAQTGRLFTEAEESAAAPVVVISDRYWTRQFGRAASAINSTLLVNNTPRTIIGVAPSAFTGVMVGTPSDLWLPLTAQHDVHYRSNASNENADDEKPWTPQDGMSWLAVIGRATPERRAAAIAAMTGLYQQVVAERAKQFENPDRRERALHDHLLTSSGARGLSNARQDATPALAILMGMVALVLVVACANLANLLLARGAARSREFALRLSIGARRGRLIRQLLTESLTLSALGGIVGLGMAWWGGVALLTLMSPSRTAPAIAMPLDWRIVSFGLALTVLTGLGFGLLPALRLSRPELLDAMKSGGRVVSTGRRGRFSLVKVLVGVQVAISLLLLAGAMLFFQTFRNCMHMDPGFDRDAVVSARFDTR
ncbi:MAG: ABC transporter permease, partial [Acidobacteria bacterium]|nr:ABC transporter permease [Acidobacteriota bacterium]